MVKVKSKADSGDRNQSYRPKPAESGPQRRERQPAWAAGRSNAATALGTVLEWPNLSSQSSAVPAVGGALRVMAENSHSAARYSLVGTELPAPAVGWKDLFAAL